MASVDRRQAARNASGQCYANTVSDFNKLWAGQTISVLGSAVTTFALPTIAVLRLHATPFQVGLLTALGMLPFPILGVFVGVRMQGA